MIATNIYQANHSIGKSTGKINTYLRCQYLRFYVIDYTFLTMHNLIFVLVDSQFPWYTLNGKYNKHMFGKRPLARCASVPCWFAVGTRAGALGREAADVTDI
jgi:hypothetical protein